MQKTLPSCLLLLTLAGAASSCQQLAPGGDALRLWDGGEPAEAGWRMCGPGSFVLEEGMITSAGGMGMLWYAERDFQDFELELEWMVEDVTHNSGVFVRFPDPGNDPWVAVKQGYEIQICDTGGAKHDTGSVYSFKAATAIPTGETGTWNRYRIRVVGQEYRIEVNGQLVNEFTGERSERGYIGLQNHDDASPVHFRNIRVREIKS